MLSCPLEYWYLWCQRIKQSVASRTTGLRAVELSMLTAVLVAFFALMQAIFSAAGARWAGTAPSTGV